MVKYAPMSTTAPDAQGQATTFLLAEHSRLCELYLSTRETAERRVTLFLTLTTTIVGVSVALSQLGIPTVQLLEVALASSLGIFFLGIITFHRLLERSMQGTEYLRAINRIHHYFVKHAPEIEPYLFWAPYDDIPRYDTRGVGGAETREVILLVDCIFFAIIVGLAVTVLNQLQNGGFDLWFIAIVAGLVAFVIALFAHHRYERFVLAREEKSKAQIVRYPFPQNLRTEQVKSLTTNEP